MGGYALKEPVRVLNAYVRLMRIGWIAGHMTRPKKSVDGDELMDEWIHMGDVGREASKAGMAFRPPNLRRKARHYED
jgi:hypothetical protein